MARPEPDLPDEERGPHRRCIATGEVKPKEALLRFVVGPEGEVVPDLEEKLPGRGIWLSPGRDMVNTAVTKNLFAKAARAKVKAPDDLADRLEALMRRRCLNLLGLARRAGQAIAGYEKVKAELKAGHGAVLFAACDAAEGGRDKIRALAPGLPLVDQFTAAELGSAFGRDHTVHVVLTPGQLAQALIRESSRLAAVAGGDGLNR